jgi:hypothetical protein
MTHPTPKDADFLLVQVCARAIALHRDAHGPVTRADIEMAAKLLTAPWGPLPQFRWQQFTPATNGGHTEITAATPL